MEKHVVGDAPDLAPILRPLGGRAPDRVAELDVRGAEAADEVDELGQEARVARVRVHFRARSPSGEERDRDPTDEDQRHAPVVLREQRTMAERARSFREAD